MTLQTPPLSRRHSGAVQLALGAAIITAATIATATALQSAPSTDTARSETMAPQSPAPIATVVDSPAWDRWYLDDSRLAPGGSTQIYEPPARDQWYLDQ